MNILTSTMKRDAAISFPMLGDWSINPPSSIDFFGTGLQIYFYGLIIAAGFILAALYCARRPPEFGIKSGDI